ncbi:MAG: metallophosphoesterase family protein [Halothiobacillaceae bacterium]|jgi:putative phosphoesterase|nr:metallophosphoesterase family protein [Halothiobacillaceae bacterium]
MTPFGSSLLNLEQAPHVRVALLSDTHGFVDERVLDVVRLCDIAVHAGDIVGPSVLAALQPRSGHVIAVRGNNDTAEQWPEGLEHLLNVLPEQAHIALPGGQLAVEHGHRVLPARDRARRLRARHPQARAVVFGHTHRLLIEQDEAIWLLNPGAAGRTRTHGGPSCLVLHASREGWHLQVHRFPARG